MAIEKNCSKVLEVMMGVIAAARHQGAGLARFAAAIRQLRADTLVCELEEVNR